MQSLFEDTVALVVNMSICTGQVKIKASVNFLYFQGTIVKCKQGTNRLGQTDILKRKLNK